MGLFILKLTFQVCLYCLVYYFSISISMLLDNATVFDTLIQPNTILFLSVHGGRVFRGNWHLRKCL